MSETVRGASETGDGLKTRLRCESCGYDIAGIGVGGRCSECGLAVIESMPERRVGTPWQRGRGWSAYSSTMYDALIRPRTLLRTANNRPGRNIEFCSWNALLSAAMLCCTVSVLIGLEDAFRTGEFVRLLPSLVGGLIFSVCAAVAVGFVGLMVFYVAWFTAAMRVRKFPTDTGILAASVASAWLVVGAGMCALGFLFGVTLGPFALVLFPTGLLIGLGGYFLLCYRALVWVQYANFPGHGESVGVRV